jgi:hypothetical protein
MPAIIAAKSTSRSRTFQHPRLITTVNFGIGRHPPRIAASLLAMPVYINLCQALGASKDFSKFYFGLAYSAFGFCREGDASATSARAVHCGDGEPYFKTASGTVLFSDVLMFDAGL